MNFAETQDLMNSDKKEKLLDHLDQIYHKTRNISKENSPIDTGETFFIHLKEMLNSYKSSDINVIIKKGNPIDWVKISDDKKIALQRVLQELMVNMKKHSQATFVVIGFDAGLKHINISYSDNGVGCTNATILKNGLQNAENRIQAIKGRLTFDFSSPRGFKVEIVIPI
jgi:signal transduction histidine kinase